MKLPGVILIASLSAAISVPKRSDSTVALDACLNAGLSKNASIDHSASAAPRWSEFAEVKPGTVVEVAIEEDVQVAVLCANSLNLTFLAQSGGNGWATTFKIGPKDMVINLRRLNQITFSEDRSQVVVQGGTITSELVDAAYQNDAQVVTGNCNCIGVMGALLGGGYGRLMGKHGFMIDNLLSLDLVTAYGIRMTVTPSNPDLWFALRGAGANFGIVTSASIKSYPTAHRENGAWLGLLVYSPDDIEALISAINNLTLSPLMAIFMYFATTGAPTYDSAVIALPFYLGNTTAGRDAFDSVLKVGPISDSTVWTPYNEVNAGSGAFCVPGDRKPSYGAAVTQLDPATWRNIWNKFNNFLDANGRTQVGNSSVLMEAYSLETAIAKSDSSSAYAWRSKNRYNIVAAPWYADAGFDPTGEAFGRNVRDMLRSTGGLPENSTYINFAFGDESLEQIYGSNVGRLQGLKKRHDPFNRFQQFFPLVT